MPSMLSPTLLIQIQNSSLPYPSLLHGVNVAADKLTLHREGFSQIKGLYSPVLATSLSQYSLWIDLYPDPSKAPQTRKAVPAGMAFRTIPTGTELEKQKLLEKRKIIPLGG